MITLIWAVHTRPHSVSFLGKETDTATPLRLENFGRIDFSLGRWITRGKKRPSRWHHMPRSQENLSEFFFIHYCGRSDHFYMASRLSVLNKVYFSRYSWVGFVKKLSTIFVSNASSSCNKWQVEKANVAHPDTLARQCARKGDCEVCNMAQVMSMTLLQCAVSDSSSHREQELVDLNVPPPNADNLLCLFCVFWNPQDKCTSQKKGKVESPLLPRPPIFSLR